MKETSVDEKLFENRYRIDPGRPHIRINNPDSCKQCETRPCTFCCPAGCYTLEENGAVILITDGCLECGTCRLVCDEIEWSYPRGGFGILYKFG